jgi:DNA-directed RNA polymerase specialized sigma24 family protein
VTTEEEVFATIYKHYLPRVYEHAYASVHHPLMAQDVTAGTFELAYRRYAEQRGDDVPFNAITNAPNDTVASSDVEAWLLGLADEVMADYTERQNRRPAAPPPTPLTPEQQEEFQRRTEAMKAANDALDATPEAEAKRQAEAAFAGWLRPSRVDAPAMTPEQESERQRVTDAMQAATDVLKATLEAEAKRQADMAFGRLLSSNSQMFARQHAMQDAPACDSHCEVSATRAAQCAS